MGQIQSYIGTDSIGSPLGSCTEEFLNNKILDVAVRNSFPTGIIEKFKNNPYKLGVCQKFNNGRFSGKYFIMLLNS